VATLLSSEQAAWLRDNGGTIICGLVVLGVVYIVLSIVIHIRGIRRFRREVSKRRPVSTGEFLAAIGAEPGHEAVYVAIRETLAEQAKIRPEVVYPTDTFELIYRMTFYGFDSIEFVMALEDAFGCHIPDEIAEKIPFPSSDSEYASTTLADCVRGMLESEEVAKLVMEHAEETKARR